MKPIAVRTRLTLVYTGVLAVLLAGLGFAAYRVLSAQLESAANSDLKELTDGLHGYLRLADGAPTFVYDRSDPAQVAFIESATRFYQLYDLGTGELVVQSPAMSPLAVGFTADEVKEYGAREGVRDIVTDQGRLRFSSTVVRLGPDRAYLLQVGVLLKSMDRALREFLGLLLWGIPIGLIVAAAASRWMAGRSLAPMRKLSDAARSIGVHALDRRMPVRGAGDEPDQVAAAFNETLARLEASVDEMRQFSAALAHELRTPLAALRGEIETLLLHPRSPDEYQRGLVSQLEDIDKLSRMVSQLLTLARAESGEIQLARDPVDLSSLAQSIVSQLETLAEAKGLTLTCDAPAPVRVTGDEGWIERLVLNLLDNAIKFTASGGRLTLSVFEKDGAAHVVMRDTGIGVAAADLPRIFERFYRADSARSPQTEGTGLGLTLAKWIADRHGATITASSEPGAGTAITVVFRLTR
ncbi:MAG: HAMP domain-containing protein [Acidobacteria bacterium]|nr:MAG: HAMP domain-containing protein [Acidobacteriota bacterium]